MSYHGLTPSIFIIWLRPPLQRTGVISDKQWLTVDLLCSSAYREPSFGHGVMTVFNATTALWQW